MVCLLMYREPQSVSMSGMSGMPAVHRLTRVLRNCETSPAFVLLSTDVFRYTLSDALAVGVWLNIFVRQAKYVSMANIAQSVNVISPLMTSKKGIVRQTTWYPLLLFCKYMHGHTIAVNVCCAEYEGPTQPDWIRGACETPWLDVSATVKDGMISI